MARSGQEIVADFKDFWQFYAQIVRQILVAEIEEIQAPLEAVQLMLAEFKNILPDELTARLPPMRDI